MLNFFKKICSNIRTLSSVFLLLAICLSVFNGCSAKDKNKDKDYVKDKDYLYNWLLENGELVDNTELLYKDNAFTLSTKGPKKIFVEYKTTNSDGYEITVQLPLYSKSEKVSTEISVESEDAGSTLTYYHIAKSFTRKSPIEYGSTSNYPPFETINLNDYGELIYENGKYVLHVDENKREEYEQRKNKNAEIEAQHIIHEDIAKDLSHESLCTILDWLKKKICPLAKMEISDFGYNAYK